MRWGRSQGGRGATPWGFRAPRAEGNSGGSNRNPHRSHEICVETDNKHVRAVGGPLTIWARQKSRAPVTIRGPSDSQSSSVILLNIRGPPNCQGPREYQGSSEHQGPSAYQGPSDSQGPSQPSLGPLNIRALFKVLRPLRLSRPKGWDLFCVIR